MDTAKAVLRGEFIAVNIYMKKKDLNNPWVKEEITRQIRKYN